MDTGPAQMQVDTNTAPIQTSTNTAFNVQPLLNGHLPDVIKVRTASIVLTEVASLVSHPKSHVPNASPEEYVHA